MRITLNLADDAATYAREFAEKHNVTLGQAVTILIRRGRAAGDRDMKRPDWYTPLSGPPDGPIVTVNFVNELLAALDEPIGPAPDAGGREHLYVIPE